MNLEMKIVHGGSVRRLDLLDQIRTGGPTRPTHLGECVLKACRKSLVRRGAIEVSDASPLRGVVIPIEEQGRDKWSAFALLDIHGFAHQFDVCVPMAEVACIRVLSERWDAEAHAVLNWATVGEDEHLDVVVEAGELIQQDLFVSENCQPARSYVVRNAAGDEVWRIDDVPRGDVLALIGALQTTPRIEEGQNGAIR